MNDAQAPAPKPSGCTVSVNGTPVTVPAGTTVADLVAAHAPSARGIAVAVNRDVVPRSAWTSTTPTDGDRVEILAAAQGG